MSRPLISEDQRDALQEITNIGMGQAGASIAKVLGEFVELSVPTIASLHADEIPSALSRLAGDGAVSAVRQAFLGELRGEAIVIFGPHSVADLAELLCYDDALDAIAEQEMLLDIGNVLVGACLGGVAQLLKVDIGFSAPSLLAHGAAAADLIQAENMAARCALLVEVRFGLEQRTFKCHLVMLMPEDAIAVLGLALDRFIESL